MKPQRMFAIYQDGKCLIALPDPIMPAEVGQMGIRVLVTPIKPARAKGKVRRGR